MIKVKDIRRPTEPVVKIQKQFRKLISDLEKMVKHYRQLYLLPESLQHCRYNEVAYELEELIAYHKKESKS